MEGSLRKAIVRVFGVLAISCSASCASEPGRAKVVNLTSGVQVGIGQCVTAVEDSRGLADQVLTAVVSKGVNLLGAALTKAGEDETFQAIGNRNLTGGTSPFPSCVQVVRGRFKTDSPESSAPWLGEITSVEGAYEQLQKNGLWPADRPDFFFEGAIIISPDNGAATIRPLLATMNTAQGSSGRDNTERNVTIFLTFSAPGTNPNISSNPAATIVLGPMSSGHILQFPSSGIVKNTSTPYEAAWFTLSESDSKKPLTLTAMIAETKGGIPFFKFLASIFNDESVKSALTEKAQLIIVPGAQETADLNRAAERQTAADSADTKLAHAMAKLQECHAAGSSALAKGAEAKSSLRAYLAADSALPEPRKKIGFEDIDRIDLFDPETIAERCNDIYEKFTGERL